MTDLTVEQVDEIEARLQFVSRGPWKLRDTSLGKNPLYPQVIVRDGTAVLIAQTYVEPQSPMPQADAEFIAHARTDIPALIASLRSALDTIQRVEALRNARQRSGSGLITIPEIDAALGEGK